MRYEKGRDSAGVGPVAAAVDDGERHLIVPLGCVKEEVRSSGLRVMIGVGMRGRVLPATSSNSSSLSTDWYRLTLASLKSGRLAPSASLRPSSRVKVK